MKTQKTPSPPQQPSKPASGPGALTRALGVATVCTLAAGCPGPGPQVRPTPTSEPCPPGAVEAMRKLGIELGVPLTGATLLPGEGAAAIPVREGPVTAEVTASHELPAGSTLTGRFIIGEERAYARFTRAVAKEHGIDIPVCLEAWDLDGGRGIKRYGKQPTDTESARIGSEFIVRAVAQFE